MTDTGLFGPGSVTWRVHLEPVMWVGGLRALILQALHPRVMRGTYQNSALFDPAKAWPRFERTAQFVTVRTFGRADEVETAARRVRRLHAKLRGFDPDTGETFRLDEPEHLLWVHCAEIDSYVDVAKRAGILDDAGADAYIAESVRAAEVVGAPIVGAPRAPRSQAEMKAYFERVRPGLRLTEEACRATANLVTAAMPAPVMTKVAMPPISALAVGTLPRWARRLYGLPGLPPTDLGTKLALRALRGATQLLPEIPAPPEIERARALMRAS